MGLLKSLFNSSNSDKNQAEVKWIPFQSNAQLEEIKKASNDQAVVIFKHSTRCGISSIVKNRFEKSIDEELKDLKIYYLDLIAYRDISNKVADEFNVKHESPQLIVLKNQEVVIHDSHYDISSIDLKTFL